MTSGEKYGIGGNLLHAKRKEQNSVPISLHSVGSAQKPEMLTRSEIDFDFHSRAPGSRAECFQVPCSSAVNYHSPCPPPLESVAILLLGKRLKERSCQVGWWLNISKNGHMY